MNAQNSFTNMKRTLFTTMSTMLLIAATAGCAATYSNLAEDHVDLVPGADDRIAESPENADMRVQRERVMHVTATCAYDTLADVERWRDWDPSITATRMVVGDQIAEGTVFFQEVSDFRANARVLAARPGRLLRWRGQAPSGNGVVGVHTWTFLPRSDGTTLVINDEHFHGWYLRPLGWFSDLGISEQFDVSLAALETAARARCGS